MKKCKIKSVKFVGVQKTYNVTMRGDQHNYFIYPKNRIGVVTSNSHSLAYAYVAYQTAYLKRYYTLEFFCSLLSSVIDDKDKRNAYKAEARTLGVKFLDLHINKSVDRFEIEGDSIRPPLAIADGVGMAAMKAIVRTRPYTNFEDFVNRVDTRVVNTAVVKNLAACREGNAFRPLGITPEMDIATYYEAKKKDLQSRKVRKDRFVSGALFGKTHGGVFKG